jgi:DNA-binding MurR/RpiR family transcriptional regulator
MAAAAQTVFIARMRDASPTPDRSEMRFAAAILHFPGRIANTTASEIARMAGVPNATVI